MQDSENKELIALLDLLDEPDPQVYRKIRDKILSFGTDVIPVLEDFWENTFDALVQGRIEDLIHTVQFDNLQFELTNWQHFTSHDLLQGFILISRYQYPELDDNEIIRRVEQIKWDIWLELNDSLTPLEKIKVVNHVMFDIYKYGANKLNPNALQNHFINTVLDTSRGNPLSLGILYLIFCQKLDIPVMGVDLPEHFVLAFTNDIREGEIVYKRERQEVLFYINPFKKGAVFTRREVELYLAQIKLDPEPAFYMPCDNVAVIRRLLNSLIQSYKFFNLADKVRELEVLAGILQR